MADRASDEEQLLRLHRDWYCSNFDIDIPLMRTLFAIRKLQAVSQP